MSAMGVLNAAAERGLSVPKDLSLIGWDNVELASFPFINLTTLQLPKRDMGAAAATLLMERIHGKRRVKTKETIFPIELIVRGSTGPAPKARRS
jgi:LacI family transcriptional regulator